MRWLAEQGLAPKRVFLVIISQVIFLVVEIAKVVLKKKEDGRMGNKLNTIDVLNVSLNIINSLSGNIAGGALLANAL